MPTTFTSLRVASTTTLVGLATITTAIITTLAVTTLTVTTANVTTMNAQTMSGKTLKLGGGTYVITNNTQGWLLGNLTTLTGTTFKVSTLTGGVLHAERTLTSSGTLKVVGASTLAGVTATTVVGSTSLSGAIIYTNGTRVVPLCVKLNGALGYLSTTASGTLTKPLVCN